KRDPKQKPQQQPQEREQQRKPGSSDAGSVRSDEENPKRANAPGDEHRQREQPRQPPERNTAVKPVRDHRRSHEKKQNRGEGEGRAPVVTQGYGTVLLHDGHAPPRAKAAREGRRCQEEQENAEVQ